MQKKSELALIGTLLSVAQNTWHKQKRKKLNSSKEEKRKNMLQVTVPIFFYLMKSEKGKR